MANTVTNWLSGDVIPIGSTTLIFWVDTDSDVASVEFKQTAGAAALTDLPPGRVNTQLGEAGDTYAETNKITVPATVTDGQTAEITVTPYDATGTAGTPLVKTLTCHQYTADSGAKALTAGNFILTPTQADADGKYFLLYMEAHKTDGTTVTPLEGAVVRFNPHLTSNLDFWTDTTPPIGANPLAHVNGYFVSTDANGRAALRVTAKGTTMNAYVSFDVAMVGIENHQPSVGYLANAYGEPSTVDENWFPPTAPVNSDGNIQIPDFGQTFNLEVSVNGETGQGTEGYIRYVVMNNTTLFPYPQDQDGYIPVDYSTLVQNRAEGSNFFTYIRLSPDNAKCSSPWEVGVDGTRTNLPVPIPHDGSRVAPQPRVTPDPGLDKTITIQGTLDVHHGLRLALQNFPTGTLPGYVQGQPLAVEFNYYMNGFNRDGTTRPSAIYNSVRDAFQFDSIPTITVNASGDVEFSQPLVELSYGAALNWGRNPYTNEKKRVGFEFIITQGSLKWYSQYDANTSWYWINTGNW